MRKLYKWDISENFDIRLPQLNEEAHKLMERSKDKANQFRDSEISITFRIPEPTEEQTSDAYARILKLREWERIAKAK